MIIILTSNYVITTSIYNNVADNTSRYMDYIYPINIITKPDYFETGQSNDRFLMNETSTKPTTWTLCPALLDKWHGTAKVF